MNSEKKHRNTAVGVVVNSEKKILICLSDRDNNDWKFPQGGIEENETPREAVKRELKEEVAIEITDDQILSEEKVVSYFFSNGFEIRLHPFLINYEGSSVTISREEFCEYKWMSPEEISTLKLGVRKNAYLQILKKFKLLQE